MGIKKDDKTEVVDDDTTVTNTSGFSEAELEGLSPEERAALVDDEEDKDSLTAIAGTGADTVDEDPAAKSAADKAKADTDAKAAKDAEEKAAADAADKRKAELAAMSEADRVKAEEADRLAAEETKKAAEAAAAEKSKTASTDTDAGDKPFVATYTVAPVENYDQQVKDLNAKRDEATASFKANDISVEEMLAEHNKVDTALRALDTQKLKAEIAAEQNEQNSAAQWKWEINRFVRNTAKNESIDYRVFEGCPEINRTLNAELDAQVKILGTMPANADKDGEWFLAEAHKRVKAIHGLGKAALVAAEKVEDKGAKPGERKNVRQAAAPPKTLGALPAAGESDAGGGGEFANLDALEGIELENALARLTPEQQDRYARA